MARQRRRKKKKERERERNNRMRSVRWRRKPVGTIDLDSCVQVSFTKPEVRDLNEPGLSLRHLVREGGKHTTNFFEQSLFTCKKPILCVLYLLNSTGHQYKSWLVLVNSRRLQLYLHTQKRVGAFPISVLRKGEISFCVTFVIVSSVFLCMRVASERRHKNRVEVDFNEGEHDRATPPMYLGI